MSASSTESERCDAKHDGYNGEDVATTESDDNEEGCECGGEGDDIDNDSCEKIMSEEELDDAALLDEFKCKTTVVADLVSLKSQEARLVETKNSPNAELVKSERNITIVKHLIVIRGIPAQALKNKKLMANIFGKYGEINRTYVKKSEPNTLYLHVTLSPSEMLRKLKADVDNLKAKLGTKMLSIENDYRSSESSGIGDTLTCKAEMLFSNRPELKLAISHLIQKYDAEVASPHSQQRIKNLRTVVASFATAIYDHRIPIKVHIFGSRVTGLAAEDSDVDIYLQIDNSFRGSIYRCSELQEELVELFASKMRTYPQEFRDVTAIKKARVPIVRFTHVKYNLNCDLSFKSGLSTMNSILVRTYLELDERVKFLVCAVKLWMKTNDLADRNLFTTYAQIWMVLFFLMQAQIEVVPTVLKLRHMLPQDQQEFIVEGWNCSFPDVTNIVWRSASILSGEELLLKFFEFYSDANLCNYVLCTLTGIKMEKKHFLKFYDNLPSVFKHYKSTVKRYADASLLRKLDYDFDGLCVQDPFDHCHNTTKTIDYEKFHCFVKLCKSTADILTNGRRV